MVIEGQGGAGVYRTGVQLAHHTHDGNACAGIGLPVLHNGALDGRCPAPAGQKGGVHVKGGETGQIQHRLGQQQAVGGHYQHVRGVGGQTGHGGGILKTFRLFDGQTQFQGRAFDGRHAELVAAPGGPVRLGVDGDEAAARPDGQTAQGGHGKVRRAHEH